MPGEERRTLVGLDISHYHVVAEIGRGAMGVVYEAEDTRLGRTVAIKSLTDPRDPLAARRFEREARAASALNHPHICTIHDIVEFEGAPFIVMERLEGEPLKARTGRQPFQMPDLIEVATQIASGLAAAHAKGIVHRDIKPANVFLCVDGAVKLLDFGIAKMVSRDADLAATVVGDTAPVVIEETTRTDADAGDDLTLAGTLIGTVAYMAPEQIDGGDIDARVDVFACGVMLYEMAVGQRPFAGATQPDLIAAVRHATPAAPSSSNRAVPDALDRLILRCLEKDPAHRYASGEELHSALVALHQPAESAVTTTVAPTAAARAKRGRKAAVDSIAVLPFENRSPDADADFVSDGVTESLINHLAELRQIRVVARSVVNRYKGREIDPVAVGAELRVRAVLTGHATLRGSTLVVGAELVDVVDGSQVWGQIYQHAMTDVMGLIDTLPREICQALELRLSPDDKRRVAKRHTENARAYELYLRGRFQWNQRTPESIAAAIAYFEQAIAEDPAFAVAHAGLADCYTALCFYDAASPVAVCPKAKAAVTRALEIDPSLAEAHASAGMLWAIRDFDWVESARAFTRAIELRPGYASAHHWQACGHSALGKDDAATAAITQALELEPLSLAINVDAALVAYRARRYDAAVARCVEMSASAGAFTHAAHHVRGRCALQTQDREHAIREFQAALATSATVSDRAYLALAYGRAGRESEGRALLAELIELGTRTYVPAFYRALIHIGLGETDAAFVALSAACDERYPHVVYFGSDPIFDVLRPDARFASLLTRVGLTTRPSATESR